MDDTGDPAQNGQTDVDQEVNIASALQENTQRRQDECEDELADVTWVSSQSKVAKVGIQMRHWWEAGNPAVRPTAALGSPETSPGWEKIMSHLRSSERHDCSGSCAR